MSEDINYSDQYENLIHGFVKILLDFSDENLDSDEIKSKLKKLIRTYELAAKIIHDKRKGLL